MNGVAVHGWDIPSMDRRAVGGRKSIHEMYGRIPWKTLPSMEMPPIHGNASHPWMVGIHEWDATPAGAQRALTKLGAAYCRLLQRS